MKKKDTMKMRREWVNEVLDTLNDLEEKAETNGESALMWEVLKTVRDNIEIIEQGGNALFLCRRADVQDSAFSSIPHLSAICQVI